jgi:glycosyltransferase involved in cell wall biosynthesis
MAGNAQAEHWVRELGIARQVNLLPALPRAELPALFQHCAVVVSPTTHDGTPNTLLEALACGCFPVAGDLESIREWIEPGRNGLLVDPGDAQALAQAVLQGLADQTLVRQARVINLALIAERVEYSKVMTKAWEFYRRLV